MIYAQHMAGCVSAAKTSSGTVASWEDGGLKLAGCDEAYRIKRVDLDGGLLLVLFSALSIGHT
jgi:hypothetical protein